MQCIHTYLYYVWGVYVCFLKKHTHIIYRCCIYLSIQLCMFIYVTTYLVGSSLQLLVKARIAQNPAKVKGVMAASEPPVTIISA